MKKKVFLGMILILMIGCSGNIIKNEDLNYEIEFKIEAGVNEKNLKTLQSLLEFTIEDINKIVLQEKPFEINGLQKPIKEKVILIIDFSGDINLKKEIDMNVKYEEEYNFKRDKILKHLMFLADHIDKNFYGLNKELPKNKKFKGLIAAKKTFFTGCGHGLEKGETLYDFKNYQEDDKKNTSSAFFYLRMGEWIRSEQEKINKNKKASKIIKDDEEKEPRIRISND